MNNDTFFILSYFELCIWFKLKWSSSFLNVHSIHKLPRTIKNSPLQNCVFIRHIDKKKNGAIGRSAIVDFLLNLGVVAFLAEITWERNMSFPLRVRLQLHSLSLTPIVEKMNLVTYPKVEELKTLMHECEYIWIIFIDSWEIYSFC